MKPLIDEEIPEELDKSIHIVKYPSETRRFSNKFQQLRFLGTKFLDMLPSNVNEFDDKTKQDMIIRKSVTTINFDKKHRVQDE